MARVVGTGIPDKVTFDNAETTEIIFGLRFREFNYGSKLRGFRLIISRKVGMLPSYFCLKFIA